MSEDKMTLELRLVLLASTDNVQAIGDEFDRVVSEIGNVDSSYELVAAVMIATERVDQLRGKQ